LGPTDLDHPSPEQLTAFARGQLAAADLEAVERHIAGCDACCRALGAIPDDTVLQWLRQANASLGSLRSRSGGGTPIPGRNPDVLPELADHPRYRVVKFLGAGGMGAVYQAEHRVMGRSVALKVIDRGLLSHPTAVERFRREVRAAARLAHPNIVAAFDAGQAGELHFLVMEYLDGISLARLVERDGPLPIHRACDFARQAALGLQHAFERGMVHRDIKPHNLILTRQGQVKILDFGLARLARERGPAHPAAGAAPTHSGTVLTRDEVLLGTPDFIAPEQASDARRADIRADIYSLGCTLYFLLTGRPPFVGGSALDKLLAHSSATARPVADLRPEVPPALAAVVARLMAREPEQRYPTPAAVAAALLPFTQPLPAPERKRTWTRRRLLGLVAAAALALPVIALLPRGRRDRLTENQGTSPSARQLPAAVPAPRVLLVIAPQNFSHPEYEALRRVLTEGGAAVEVASATRAAATPDPREGGAEVVPDLTLTDAAADRFDAVVFVGGMGAGAFKQMNSAAADSARQFIGAMSQADRYVAAVGAGAGILAHWGALRGKRATGLPWLRPMMVKEGNAEYVDEPVVVAGRVLTARDATAAASLARELLRLLQAGR